MLQYSRAIADYFPEGTLASRPQGSFVQWVEFTEKIDSFVPGRIFTLHDQYRHCLRLNFGLVWDEQPERNLQRIGTLAKQWLKMN